MLRNEPELSETGLDAFTVALRRCGVLPTTLTPAERDALDRDGYALLGQVAPPERLQRMRAAFESAAQRGENDGKSESGTRHLADLSDPCFDCLVTHPKVLAAVHHVLQRPLRVFQLSGRDPLPGFGRQGLHTDWLPRPPRAPFDVVTVLWLLDDFTPHNGATRLIPGSHLWPRSLPKSMQQPEGRHRDEKLVVAGAGSVLAFNGHIYHSGTRNESRASRRVLQCQFAARDAARSGASQVRLPARLDAAARALLGG